jgi:hypothetical protein
VVGGIIPAADEAALLEAGVARIYEGGSAQRDHQSRNVLSFRSTPSSPPWPGGSTGW